MLLKLLFIAASLSITPVLAADEIYVRVALDPNGKLHIFTQDRREILPAIEKDQTGFDQAAIAPNRRSVGWLALYPNCCTSYPIPLKLVIYSNGKMQAFTGNELPIWRWRFLSSGRQFAFEQETVHGGLSVHYELHDLTSGKRLAEYEPEPGKAATPPAWVEELDSEK